MRDHLRYLIYVLRHKWYVLIGCLKLDVSLWQALIHDWTKFLPVEWVGYVERMRLGKNSTWHSAQDTAAYARAWKHHWSHNPHHWEYWHTPQKSFNVGDYVFCIADNAPFHGVVTDVRSNGGYAINTGKRIEYFHAWEVLDRIMPMPEKYVREMVADWYGAGMAQGKPDIQGWYEANKHRRFLHPDTEARVAALVAKVSHS